MTVTKTRVLFVQQYFRFYRTTLFRRLAAIPELDLTMIHGTNPPITPDVAGLNMGRAEDVPFEVIPARMNCLRIGRQQLFWFARAMKLVREREYDVVISDFFLRLLSLLPMIRLQHAKRGAILFWDIGMPLHPSKTVVAVRKFLYRRADGLILYNERERTRLTEMGIPSRKLFVAENTVDVDRIQAARQSVTPQDKRKCYGVLGTATGPILLHVGRLAEFKRLDLLLQATARLKTTWPQIRLVLIGEGPKNESLRQLTHDLGMEQAVVFPGAITEPGKLAPWFAVANAVVAPAQIGLLAPETHAYGRPLVTSDDPTISGPEAQILKPGETGATYHRGDINDLASVVHKLLSQPELAEHYGRKALLRAEKMLGVDRQARGFINAIECVVKGRRNE